jgi:hypothetical protein
VPALVELRKRELAAAAASAKAAADQDAAAARAVAAPAPTPAFQQFRVPAPPDETPGGRPAEHAGSHSATHGGSGGGLARQFSVAVPRPAKDPYGRKDFDDAPSDESASANREHRHADGGVAGGSRSSGSSRSGLAPGLVPPHAPFTFAVNVPRPTATLSSGSSGGNGGGVNGGGAHGLYQPDARATLSGAPRFQSHVPSLHGPLSGQPATRQPTFAPSQAGSLTIAQKLDEMRAAKAKQRNRLEVGWHSGYGSVLSDAAREKMLEEFMAQQDQLLEVS